jgi:xanthine dehydrogenase YagR molybdenum-binding subunit
VANLVTVRCTAVEPTASFDSPGTMSAPAKGQLAQFKEDPKVGDFAAAFNPADVKIDAAYETPPQHHNPMELFATSCVRTPALAQHPGQPAKLLPLGRQIPRSTRRPKR